MDSTFYKHLSSPHLDVLRLSNDPNEGYTDIVMSCLYVIRNKKAQSQRFKVLRGPVGKQVSLFCKGLLLPISRYNLCFYWITFDSDDVGTVGCDEVNGLVIEELRSNS